MADPDDIVRLKLFQELRDALNQTLLLNVTDAHWSRLDHALAAVKAQKALDQERRQQEKEADNE